MRNETIEIKTELTPKIISDFQREASRKMRVKVFLKARGQEASSKELFDILALNLIPGTSVEIWIDGPGEEEILENLKKILLNEV